MSNAPAKKEPGMASLVIVLALICLVIAALLGIVNGVTEGPIKANTEKTVQDSLKVVMPADSYEKVDYTGGDETVVAVYKAGEEGYVVECNSPNGFGGAIDMMAGINTSGEVTGIAIISHSETSGLGSKATDPEWQAQFQGATGTVSVAPSWPSPAPPLPPAQSATASTSLAASWNLWVKEGSKQ